MIILRLDLPFVWFSLLAAVFGCVFWLQLVASRREPLGKFWATLRHQLAAYKSWPTELIVGVDFTDRNTGESEAGYLFVAQQILH